MSLFNNLLRSDKPESPTNLIFLLGSIIALGLWIYATLIKQQIPSIEVMVTFLTACKGVKVAGDWAATKLGKKSGV